MNLLEYLIKRIENNKELKNNEELFICEIREIMQEIIMPVLSKSDFFKDNVFLGGTAFRMVHDLKRYSEDFDFTMKDNKIKTFSWKTYADEIVKNGKNMGIDYFYKEEEDKFGNKILRIRSDSILAMLDGKGIVPDEFTNKGNRKKVKIKLETNFVINSFNDEIKTFNGCNIRVFDLPSLFAGKINACLTREMTNPDTNKKEKVDHGRDWYDLIKYIEKNIEPNYKYLTDKLKNKGPFVEELKNVDLVDIKWVKRKLLERMEGLYYEKINKELKSITLEKNRVILDKKLLIDKINKFGIGSDDWGGVSNKEFVPKSIEELKIEIIKQNLDLCYGKQLDRERRYMQSQDKNGEYYEMNKTVFNETTNYFNKIIKHFTNEDIIALHEMFKVDNRFLDIKNIHFCAFRNERLKIYNCIENKCNKVIENIYPHLKYANNIYTGNSGNGGGR